MVLPARGSPQGGVLSPIIWNLITDMILSEFKSGPVKALGYADDILLYTSGSDEILLGEILQPALNKVLKWGGENGLSFNPTKTQTVLFRYNKRVMKTPTLIMNGAALELENSFKYLGVEIHKNLSWLPHVTERTNKCKFLLAKCRNIIGRSWGLTPDKMEWVHKAIIRPKLTYGSVIWAADMSPSVTKKLNHVQRLSLLAITHPLRSAPTAGLEAMLGWMPLEMHTKKTALLTYLRNNDVVQETWDGIGCQKRIRGHLYLWKRQEASILNGYPPREPRIHEYVWREPQDDYKGIYNPLRIYTDASKNKHDVGIAFAVCDGNYIIHEDIQPLKEIGIFHAEVLAIKEALSWLKKDYNEYLNRRVEIYSDSLSAVLALNGIKSKDRLCLDSMKLLKELTYVTLLWIKGHKNHTGNEYADALARKGAAEARQLAYAMPFIPLNYQTLKGLVSESYHDLWQNTWENLTDHKVSRQFIPDVTLTKITSKLGSEELQKLSQIITGHGLFKRHLRHWNELPDNDYLCALCGEDWEDSWHLWAFCPKLAPKRKSIEPELKGKYKLKERAILKFFKEDRIVQLMASNEALLTPI